MSNNLKALRTQRSLTQVDAAKLMGTTRNQYVKLEGGARRLSDVWITRAAAAFKVDPGEVVSDREKTVPLVGYVGAGSLTYLFVEQQGDLDQVPAPEGATENTVAVEIRGESLGPFFDKWLVYYDDVHQSVVAEHLNQLCVVGLDDGRIMIKKIEKSRTIKGAYNLLSQFEAPIYDAVVEWAARVNLMAPR